MTKQEFYKNYIKDNLKINDKAFNRQLFNDTKDLLHKDGILTDNQVNNWIYPQTKLFK